MYKCTMESYYSDENLGYSCCVPQNMMTRNITTHYAMCINPNKIACASPTHAYSNTDTHKNTVTRTNSL